MVILLSFPSALQSLQDRCTKLYCLLDISVLIKALSFKLMLSTEQAEVTQIPIMEAKASNPVRQALLL